MSDRRTMVEIREILSTGKEPEVLETLRDVGRDFSPENVELLFGALAHPLWSVRRQAADLLGGMKEPVIAALEDRLQSATDDQLYWSCRMLGKMGPAAAPVLGRLYSRGRRETRRYVVDALSARHSEDAIPVLVEALDDPEWVVRKAAASALIARVDRDVVADRIVEQLDPDNPNRVFWGIIVLFRTLGNRSLRIIEKLATTKDSSMRYLTLQALAVLGLEAALPRLIPTLADPSPVVRDRAIALLIRFGPKAIEPIRAQLGELEGRAIPAALRALWAIDPDSALTEAKKMLADPSEDRRHATLEALGAMHDVRAAEVLTQAFTDPGWLLRSQAHSRILGLGDKALGPLCRILYGTDQDQRYWAIRSLAKLGPRGVAPLREVCSQADREEKIFILQSIMEDDPSDEALDLLIESLDDPQWIVRRTSTALLVEQKSRSLKKILMPAAFDRGNRGYWARRILEEIKPTSGRAFLEFLQKKDLAARRALLSDMARLTAPELESLLDEGAEALVEALRKKPATRLPAISDTARATQLDRLVAEGVEEILALLVARKGEAVHLTLGSPPALRRKGEMTFLEQDAMDRETFIRFFTPLLPPVRKKEFIEKKESLVFTFHTTRGDRYKARLFHEKSQPAAIITHIGGVPLLDPLLEPLFEDRELRRGGLVLVSTPPAGGLSTLMASVLDWYARNRPAHVTSIERNIEHVLESQTALLTQKEVGADVASHRDGLQDAVLQGADVIAIDEIPDARTLADIVEAVECGKVIIAAMRSGHLEGCWNHLVDMAREVSPAMPGRLARALAYHVHQMLLPHLSEPGMVPVREVLRGTRPVEEALTEGRLHELGELLRSGSTDGQRSRDLELERRVFAGDLSYDEAFRWCRHRRTFTMEKIFGKTVS